MDTTSIFLTTSLATFFSKDVRILLYISISTVIIFTTIAVCTLQFFKSTRKSILKNFYICLLSLEISFLLGIEQNESSIFCGFTTVFIHSFSLSAIAWFSFNGYYFYKESKMLVNKTVDEQIQPVQSQSSTGNNLPFYLLSYGISFSIVAISLLLKPEAYTRNDFCVLLEEEGIFFYVVFITPAILYLLVRIILYTFHNMLFIYTKYFLDWNIPSYIWFNKLSKSVKNKLSKE